MRVEHDILLRMEAGAPDADAVGLAQHSVQVAQPPFAKRVYVVPGEAGGDRRVGEVTMAGMSQAPVENDANPSVRFVLRVDKIAEVRCSSKRAERVRRTRPESGPQDLKYTHIIHGVPVRYAFNRLPLPFYIQRLRLK